jgi:predicted Zn-dependent protease
VNAFAAPGGYIYFYTGLLKMMDNEAEMAAVMAHEISHVVARHGVKRLQAAMGVDMAYQIVFGGDQDSQLLDGVIQLGLGLAFADYSRDNEREADLYGIEYMKRAGYNPSASITMFEKLAAAGDAGTANTFEKLASSHPETQERISNARAQIQSFGGGSANLVLGAQKYTQMKARLP